MKRRQFLRNAAIGMGAIAEMELVGSKAEGLDRDSRSDHKTGRTAGWNDGLGRPVRIVSIGLKNPLPLEKISTLVDQEGFQGTDMIVLPETVRGVDKASEETLHGPTVTAMRALASKHKTYIVCPIDRRDGRRRVDSAVLLDRSGQIVCVYNKVFPFWGEPFVPGQETRVYQTDFGPVGFAICFDVNFPEVWRRLGDQGAGLVIWPSDYSGGRSLQAHAINEHYYIVTCSRAPDCIAYDITGERLLYKRTENEVSIGRITLDMDRCIFHENFNIQKRDKLLKEHAGDVEQDEWLRPEQWFVLRAKRPGVSARALARQYGLEELRHFISRSRIAVDKRRGWEFEEKVVFPNEGVAELEDLASKTAIGKRGSKSA